MARSEIGRDNPNDMCNMNYNDDQWGGGGYFFAVEFKKCTPDNSLVL